MENILIRFPVVGQKIFKQLDDKSLVKSMEVNKTWFNTLANNTHLWRRRIQTNIKYQVKFSKDWKSATNKVPIKILKELAFAVEEFFKLYPEELENPEISPLDIVSEVGMFSLFKFIAKKVNEINPANIDGATPLHYSAGKGRLEIVIYIVENLEDKNPSRNDKCTPLHNAALFGHLEVVKCIASYLENKNPLGKDEETPFLLAATEGHLEIVKYLGGYLDDKNPAKNGGWTTLHFASQEGHLEQV